MSDYWLGVLTVPAIVIAGAVVAALRSLLRWIGFFMAWGGTDPGALTTPWSVRRLYGWNVLHVGSYATTVPRLADGGHGRGKPWGSRFVKIGCLTIGLVLMRWGLDDKPPAVDVTPDWSLKLQQADQAEDDK